jgi:hypothetical protein
MFEFQTILVQKWNYLVSRTSRFLNIQNMGAWKKRKEKIFVCS